MRPVVFVLGALLIACEDDKEEVVEDGIVDTDGDGVADADDLFPDDPNESVDTDGDGVGDNSDAFPEDETESADTDGDGVGDNSDAFPDDPDESVDADEDGVGANADCNDGDPDYSLDADGDGLDDCQEVELGTDHTNADSDGDGLSDLEETEGTTDPLNADSDNDGLNDGDELAAGTDPNNIDSDGDGATDGQEVDAGTDPNDAQSGGADPVLPDAGLWDILNPNVSSDGCNLISTLATLGEDIYAVIPADFTVENVTNNSFDGTISGETATCTVVGTSFTCGAVTTTESFDVLGDPADIELELALQGIMTDSTQMSLSLAATLNSCNGAGCTLVGLLVPIPCTVSLDADGEHQQVSGTIQSLI